MSFVLVTSTDGHRRLRVSIITSYIKYGHYITGLQVLALGFVFMALFYKSCPNIVEEALEGLWRASWDVHPFHPAHLLPGYDGLVSESPEKKAEKTPLVPKNSNLDNQLGCSSDARDTLVGLAGNSFVHFRLSAFSGDGETLETSKNPVFSGTQEDMAKHGNAWQGMARHGKAWQSMAKHGTAWQSMATHGKAWR